MLQRKPVFDLVKSVFVLIIGGLLLFVTVPSIDDFTLNKSKEITGTCKYLSSGGMARGTAYDLYHIESRTYHPLGHYYNIPENVLYNCKIILTDDEMWVRSFTFYDKQTGEVVHN